MKTQLITIFSIITAIVFLTISNQAKSDVNSTNNSNAKACKHNGAVYSIILMNQLCVFNHTGMSSQSLISPQSSYSSIEWDILPRVAKESHICVLTEEPLSGL